MSVGCCNARADKAAVDAANKSPISMGLMRTLTSLGLITMFVTAILCFAGPLSANAQLASMLMLGGATIGALAVVTITPLRNHRQAWLGAFITVAIASAIFVPGILGCYSSNTLGWIYFGPTIASVGIAMLVGYSCSAKRMCCP